MKPRSQQSGDHRIIPNRDADPATCHVGAGFPKPDEAQHGVGVRVSMALARGDVLFAIQVVVIHAMQSPDKRAPITDDTTLGAVIKNDKIVNALAYIGIQTVGQFCEAPDWKLVRDAPNFGEKSLAVAREAVEKCLVEDIDREGAA